MQPKIDPIARYSGFKDRLPVIGGFGVGAPGHRAWFGFSWRRLSDRLGSPFVGKWARLAGGSREGVRLGSLSRKFPLV